MALASAGLPLTFVVGSSVIATISSPAPDRIEKVFGLQHRRITHRPFVQLTVIAALTYAAAMLMRPDPPIFAVVVGVGLAFGCVMHSVADAMTVESYGIELLWPISRRGYHLLPWSLRVWADGDAPSQKVFVAVWLAFVLIYVYERYGNLILS